MEGGGSYSCRFCFVLFEVLFVFAFLFIVVVGDGGSVFCLFDFFCFLLFLGCCWAVVCCGFFFVVACVSCSFF